MYTWGRHTPTPANDNRYVEHCYTKSVSHIEECTYTQGRHNTVLPIEECRHWHANRKTSIFKLQIERWLQKHFYHARPTQHTTPQNIYHAWATDKWHKSTVQPCINMWNYFVITLYTCASAWPHHIFFYHIHVNAISTISDPHKFSHIIPWGV